MIRRWAMRSSDVQHAHRKKVVRNHIGPMKHDVLEGARFTRGERDVIRWRVFMAISSADRGRFGG